MNTLMTVWNAVSDTMGDTVGTILAAPGDKNGDGVTPMSSTAGTTLLERIRNFLMPFILIAIAAISLTFLVRRQTSQFLQFIGISIAVLVLVYSPEIIAAAAKLIGGFFSQPASGG